MPSDNPATLAPLIRKLESVFPLSEPEEEAIGALPVHVREIREDQDIVREGDRPSQCGLLIEGFACRYQAMGDGRRQIMSFHIPGDIPDLLSLHLPVMDHDLGTLAPSKVGLITHRDLQRVVDEHPRIGKAFWRDTLIDAAVFRAWMTGMG